MDKRKIFCVISVKQKKIFATNKTEKQAKELCNKLEASVPDVSIINNVHNALADKKYDKFIFSIN